MNFRPEDNITPEEKLLRLIRKDKKKVYSQMAPGEKRKEDKLSPENKAAITGGYSSSEGFSRFYFIKSINFSLVNNLIILVVLVASALFLPKFFYAPSAIQETREDKAVEKKELIQERKIFPLEHYQQAISGRTLFKVPAQEVKQVQLIPKSRTFSQLLQGLALIGIVSGDNPRAIIEDRKENQTYFVHTGDYLGDIQVLEIESRRVKLGYQGEIASLFL